MDCEHRDVRLTEEPVEGLSHVASVCYWFTCYVCGERAVVVVKTEMIQG